MAAGLGPAESGEMPRRSRDEALLRRFGARAAELRARVHLTQQAVADRIGVRPEAISQMESGKLSPTLTSIVGLATALNVRTGVLLDFDAAPVPGPFDADEQALLDDYRALGVEERALVRSVAQAIRR